MREQLAAQYDSLYASTDRTFRKGRVLPVVEVLAGKLTSGTVLDVGGGQGVQALYLAERGFSVTLCDISQVGLAQAATAATAANLPLETKQVDVIVDGIDTTYDAILCTYVLHHMTAVEAKRVIAEVQTQTNVGGYNIILTFLNEGGLYERNKKAESGRYYPSVDELRALYTGWDIQLWRVSVTETLARDKTGARMKNNRAILLARKP